MALTIGAIQPSQGVPKSVAEITKDASDYEFNALVPLKYWVRTADAITKQVRSNLCQKGHTIKLTLL